MGYFITINISVSVAVLMQEVDCGRSYVQTRKRKSDHKLGDPISDFGSGAILEDEKVQGVTVGRHV